MASDYANIPKTPDNSGFIFDMHELAGYAEEAYLQTIYDFGDANSSARCNCYFLEAADSREIMAYGFPGTNNLSCWETDLNIEVIETQELGRVHEGFWKALDEIYDEMTGHNPEIWFGHSEGAALALLAAARKCVDRVPPKAVVAFEPPRVSCDDLIKKTLEANGVQVFIFRNGNDLVPTVPRTFPFFQWQHPGNLIRIGKATHQIDNVEDHKMERVTDAIYDAGQEGTKRVFNFLTPSSIFMPNPSIVSTGQVISSEDSTQVGHCGMDGVDMDAIYRSETK